MDNNNTATTVEDFDAYLISIDPDCVHQDYEISDLLVHESEEISITESDIQFE